VLSGMDADLDPLHWPQLLISKQPAKRTAAGPQDRPKPAYRPGGQPRLPHGNAITARKTHATDVVTGEGKKTAAAAAAGSQQPTAVGPARRNNPPEHKQS